MDTRRWGPGERLVFEPYTKEAHTETFDWITRHGIFAEGAMGHGRYEDLVTSSSEGGWIGQSTPFAKNPPALRPAKAVRSDRRRFVRPVVTFRRDRLSFDTLMTESGALGTGSPNISVDRRLAVNQPSTADTPHKGVKI